MKPDLNNFIHFSETSSQAEKDFISELKELETEILSKASTKTPTAVAKVMLNMFFEKYPETQQIFDGPGAIAKKNLLSAGGGDWPGLNIAARDMARIIGTNDSQRHYWDMMMYLCYEFPAPPQETERRRAERAVTIGKSFEEAYPIKKLGHCAYCWRSVPRRRGKSGTLKCHLHADKIKGPALTQKSREILTKKMNISLKQKENILLIPEVRKHLQFFSPHACPPACIAEKDREEAKKCGWTLKDVWNHYPEDLIRKFPHVEKYLTGGGVNIKSPYEIVRALDMPFDIRENEQTVKNRIKAFRLRDNCYNHYYNHFTSSVELYDRFLSHLDDNEIGFIEQHEIYHLYKHSYSKNFSSTSSTVNSFVEDYELYLSNYRNDFIPMLENEDYLSDVFKDNGVDVNSLADVVMGLKIACYPEDSSDAARCKRLAYYKDSETWFDKCHETFVLAERWLAAEASLKHGGKRAGAGRKPKQ